MNCNKLVIVSAGLHVVLRHRSVRVVHPLYRYLIKRQVKTLKKKTNKQTTFGRVNAERLFASLTYEYPALSLGIYAIQTHYNSNMAFKVKHASNRGRLHHKSENIAKLDQILLRQAKCASVKGPLYQLFLRLHKKLKVVLVSKQNQTYHYVAVLF